MNATHEERLAALRQESKRLYLCEFWSEVKALERREPGPVWSPHVWSYEEIYPRLPADSIIWLRDYLRTLSRLDERPLVLLLDEADGLVGPAMVSFLTQLRHGYIARSRAPFPSAGRTRSSQLSRRARL